MSSQKNGEAAHHSTCKTVTGIRTPWSFHSAVMPLLRAMTPVRIECGDHFGASVSGPAAAAASLSSAAAAGALAATVVRIPRAKKGYKDNG